MSNQPYSKFASQQGVPVAINGSNTNNPAGNTPPATPSASSTNPVASTNPVEMELREIRAKVEEFGKLLSADDKKS